MNQIFLILVEGEEKEINPDGSVHLIYEIEMPIYRWLGKHFDVMDSIPTSNPRKITAFTVNDLTYVAVANFQNNNGKYLLGLLQTSKSTTVHSCRFFLSFNL